MSAPVFGTCLNCIDGRIQVPVIKWARANLDVDCLDMITRPGMDGLLSDPQFDLNRLCKGFKISLETHGSTNIVIVGHHDCAGNPVSEEEHRRQIKASVERIRREHPAAHVTGVWVNSAWTVEKVA